MKTINMIADTIQQALLGIQEFVAAFAAVGSITNDAMQQARQSQALEFQKALKAAK
tara:strand:- start:510 stop:677 length:168 start_codon:yes stop_codon:yes gene_type:complete